jgi:hypothetical protein
MTSSVISDSLIEVDSTILIVKELVIFKFWTRNFFRMEIFYISDSVLFRDRTPMFLIVNNYNIFYLYWGGHYNHRKRKIIEEEGRGKRSRKKIEEEDRERGSKKKVEEEDWKRRLKKKIEEEDRGRRSRKKIEEKDRRRKSRKKIERRILKDLFFWILLSNFGAVLFSYLQNRLINNTIFFIATI